MQPPESKGTVLGSRRTRVLRSGSVRGLPAVPRRRTASQVAHEGRAGSGEDQCLFPNWLPWDYRPVQGSRAGMLTCVPQCHGGCLTRLWNP